jgi:hypothetical protein
MNSFSSWRQLNEGLFDPKNRGKVIVTVDGKKQIAKYKIQGDDKFMIKLIRNASLIDEAGNLTSQGASKLTEFINGQPEITGTIGKIDDLWFKDKILIYVVKRDTQMSDAGGNKGREKVQFIVANRADFPNLPAGSKFVNSAVARTGAESSSPIITEIVDNVEDVAVKDNTNEEPEIIEQQREEEQEVKETQDSELIGKKFRYTMRTNSKTYLMEFMDSGALSADVIGETEPNGVVGYSNEEGADKINWVTDLDDSIPNWTKNWGRAALYTDQEITNKIDRNFFIKIFTDEEFRNKIIAEYEAEWGGSEITVENLRKMLYYKNETRIFPEAGNVDTGDRAQETEGERGGDRYDGGGVAYTGQII